MELCYIRKEILEKRLWPETGQEVLPVTLALSEFD